jgi:hypothetical protein
MMNLRGKNKSCHLKIRTEVITCWEKDYSLLYKDRGFKILHHGDASQILIQSLIVYQYANAVMHNLLDCTHAMKDGHEKLYKHEQCSPLFGSLTSFISNNVLH